MVPIRKSLLPLLTIVLISMEAASQNASFLDEELIKLFFPKNVNLVRVRKLDETTSDTAVLDFIGLVEKHGYPAEEHRVTTEDGYNLLIHRIPGSPLSTSKAKKQVVFIQHGLLSSSDSWVLFGPNKDLAFLLADQGYDVWLGNFRGNSYGRSHRNMTIYDKKFWQFDIYDEGTMDLPAMLDYVLNETRQESLYYIGYSMGTTTLFTLLSTKPQYNAKIKLAICFAPVALWTEIPPMLYELVNLIPIVKEVLENYEIYDIFPQSLTTVTIAKTLCNENTVTQPICLAVIFLLAGSDPSQTDTTALANVLSYCPAGTSLKVLHHYYQNIVTNRFRNYDYGTVNNYKRYKQSTPPSYDFNKITAPIALIHAGNDVLATEKNVLELSRRLPNVVLVEEVPYKSFSHVDFMWAIDAKSLLYDRVLQILEKFNVTLNTTWS